MKNKEYHCHSYEISLVAQCGKGLISAQMVLASICFLPYLFSQCIGVHGTGQVKAVGIDLLRSAEDVV